jgi:8-oxo-dGTP diphosphatase
MEAGETEEEAIVREIREELEVEIAVERKVCTVEYDYPQFHLRMHCFWCSIAQGVPQLKEHQSARWLAKEEWESVEWLPADVEVLEQLG